MRKLLLALPLGAVALAIALGGGAAYGSEPVFDHDELLSGPASDSEATPAGASTGPTGTGRPPRVGPNMRANDAQAGPPNGLFGRSETSIAGTTDGQMLVAGWNDAQGFCSPPFSSPACPAAPSHIGLSGYAYSTDGGSTWTDGGPPPLLGTSVVTRGDPWLDRGGLDNATFYYANLAVDLAGASLGISVHRGHFSGSSFAWEDIRTFDSPHNNTLCTNPVPPGNQIPCDFYDKEALVAAKDGSGSAYVSLTNFQGQKFIGPPPGCGTLAQFGFGQIEVWRTHDGGSTWQGPAIAGPEAPDSVASCGNLGTLRQSSAPAIGPNGEVYVVSQFGPTFTPATSTDADIVFTRSLNGGVSFAPQVKVADINSMRQNPPVGYNRDRINDHPRIDVATTGPNKGRVYVVYYSSVAPVVSPAPVACPPEGDTPPPDSCRPQTLTSSQVFLKSSDNQGTTWSPAKEIGGPVPAEGVKRFWPDVSVSPGGIVHVVYYESREQPVASGAACDVRVATLAPNRFLRRRGPAHSLVDTWWTYSPDGGANWSMPLKLSTATSDWCTTASNIRPNFGDYIDAQAAGNRILGTWADGRNGVPDTFFAAGLGAGKSTP